MNCFACRITIETMILPSIITKLMQLPQPSRVSNSTFTHLSISRRTIREEIVISLSVRCLSVRNYKEFINETKHTHRSHYEVVHSVIYRFYKFLFSKSALDEFCVKICIKKKHLRTHLKQPPRYKNLYWNVTTIIIKKMNIHNFLYFYKPCLKQWKWQIYRSFLLLSPVRYFLVKFLLTLNWNFFSFLQILGVFTHRCKCVPRFRRRTAAVYGTHECVTLWIDTHYFIPFCKFPFFDWGNESFHCKIIFCLLIFSVERKIHRNYDQMNF